MRQWSHKYHTQTCCTHLQQRHISVLLVWINLSSTGMSQQGSKLSCRRASQLLRKAAMVDQCSCQCWQQTTSFVLACSLSSNVKATASQSQKSKASTLLAHAGQCDSPLPQEKDQSWKPHEILVAFKQQIPKKKPYGVCVYAAHYAPVKT